MNPPARARPTPQDTVQPRSAGQPTPIAVTRHHGFDLLRFLAVIYVLLHHIDIYSDHPVRSHPTVARADDLLVVVAMSVFFLTSGLFLGLKDAVFPDLRARVRFLGARLRRLYPEYLVALVLFLLLSGRAGLPALTVWGSPTGFPLSLGEVVQHLLLIQSLVFQRFGNELLTLWFMSVLFVFYVLFAFLFSRVRHVGGYLAWAILLCASVVLAAKYLHFPDVRLALYLPVFVLGIILSRFRFTEHLDRHAGLFLAAGLCLGLYGVVFGVPSYVLTLGLQSAVALLLVVPMLLVARLLDRSRASSRAGAYLGRLTLHLYLFHRVAFSAVVLLLGASASTSEVALGLLVVGVPASIGLAALIDLGLRRRASPPHSNSSDSSVV